LKGGVAGIEVGAWQEQIGAAHTMTHVVHLGIEPGQKQ
jgi:hypothetical protein